MEDNMQKLTKEQSEWLIKEVNNHTGYNVNLCEKALNFSAIERLINQCTEKEFPELEIESAIKISEGIKCVAMETYGDIRLSYEQFKQFTEGCNKIVEWLDEQAE